MKIASTTLCNADSANNLKDALLSVLPWVDACIIIDTEPSFGRHEHIELAKEIAKSKAVFASYQWCDNFADARNYSLQVATGLGFNYALTVDPDERIRLIEPDDDDKELAGRKQYGLIRNILRNIDSVCVMVQHESIAYAKERFFRLPIPSERKWIGPIHEGFMVLDNPWPALPHGEMFFTELDKTKEQYQAKYARDAQKLRDYVYTNQASRWYFFLGDAEQNLASLCDAAYASELGLRKHYLKRAIDAYMLCVKINDTPEESAIACFRAAQCACELGNFAMAINLCASGMTYHNGIPELPFIAACASLDAELFAQAERWAMLAIEMQDYYRERTSTRFLPAYYEGPYHIIKAAREAMRCTPEAIEWAEKMFVGRKQKREHDMRGKHDANFSMPSLFNPSGV